MEFAGVEHNPTIVVGGDSFNFIWFVVRLVIAVIKFRKLQKPTLEIMRISIVDGSVERQFDLPRLLEMNLIFVYVPD